MVTVTAVRPVARFGEITIEGESVKVFKEKPQVDQGWINGGFFVLSPKVLDYIEGDNTVWEKEPMEALAQQKQLTAFVHKGFWQPMDTLRDQTYLQSLWLSNKAPWKIW